MCDSSDVSQFGAGGGHATNNNTYTKHTHISSLTNREIHERTHARAQTEQQQWQSDRSQLNATARPRNRFSRRSSSAAAASERSVALSLSVESNRSHSRLALTRAPMELSAAPANRRVQLCLYSLREHSAERGRECLCYLKW